MDVREILLVLLLTAALALIVVGVAILLGSGAAYITAGVGLAALAFLTLTEVPS